MTSESGTTGNRPEWLAISGFTFLGAMLRFAQIGKLGLDHFDEGVYGAAGAWIHMPGGLAEFDPGLIPYSPPLFPLLMGLSYSVLGTNDVAALLVSILLGIATIPLTGWLSHRWLGRGAGAGAAAFAALSGSHIVFSRMALTDSSFLFCWLVGMAAGAEFLAKPGSVRAVVLGIAVGLAQLTKYNGWLVGAIVGLASLLGLAFQSGERHRDRMIPTLAWGVLAALISIAVYWPWFRFVDAHTGYSELLKHQRSYLGELSAWPDHLLTQLRQVVALSGGEGWGLISTVLALIGTAWSLSASWPVIRARWQRMTGLAILLLIFFPATSGWWLGVALAGFLLKAEAPRLRLLGAWWLVLSVLTPLYHPYARLWLPMEAACWLLRAWFVKHAFLLAIETTEANPMIPGNDPRYKRLVLGIILSLVVGRIAMSVLPPRPIPLPGLLDSRDSFRIATARIVSSIPPEVPFIRLLGRPTLRYYVTPPLSARGIKTVRESSLEEMLLPGEGWAIVDTAILRQEGNYAEAQAQLANRCVIVAQEATVLSPATLLDVDSSAAVGNLAGRTERLLLVRHKRPGDR